MRVWVTSASITLSIGGPGTGLGSAPAPMAAIGREISVSKPAAAATLRHGLMMLPMKGEALDEHRADSAFDTASEIMMMGLRLDEGVDLSRLQQLPGYDASWIDENDLQGWPMPVW